MYNQAHFDMVFNTGWSTIKINKLAVSNYANRIDELEYRKRVRSVVIGVLVNEGITPEQDALDELVFEVCRFARNRAVMKAPALPVVVHQPTGDKVFFETLYKAIHWLALQGQSITAAITNGGWRVGSQIDERFAIPSHYSPFKATHRHKNGGHYRFIAEGMLEQDGEIMAIYSDDQGNIWIRPLTEFADTNRFKPI